MQVTEIRGMTISRLVLGTVQLGIKYGIANKGGLPELRSRFEIIQEALEGGVNTLDTASAYGESEKVIGDYIQENRQKGIPRVVTKVSGIKPGMSEKEIFEYVINSVARSSELLRLDTIPIVLLHSFEEWKTGGNAAVEALEYLKSAGKINMAGISLYGSDDMDSVLEQPVFEAVQIPMSIFDQRLIKSGCLDQLHQRQMIVFVRSVYLQGLMFLNPGRLPGNLVKAKPFIEKLNSLSKRENRSVAELALAFVRDLPGVTGLVLGCETTEQIRQNIELIDSPPLPDNLIHEIKGCFYDIPDEVTDPRTWVK